ncbi:MAG: hypothetical protein HY791_39575 [Deltaproteobacteria bacterium]|nr:hypothetical protein [Deltaproteobacteria bacterium]
MNTKQAYECAEWSVDDEHGTRLTTGLQEAEAHDAAERIAVRLGRPVYLYEAGSEEIERVLP